MSSAIVRRVAAHTVARRPPVLTLARPYASRAEEPDTQLTDYPKLPWVSRQTLPPRGWQDEQMRRNFGETLHEQEEVLSMWGPDPPPLPPQEALKQLLLAALGFATVGYLIKENVPEMPAVRRQYPHDGLVVELGGVPENKARGLESEEE
ncbi:hypothetical protein AX14_012601 [Amanita brunnescens Koide BX004]|nr:hypothetical protein AX14_012601 [Amanita brunnescens Koide BX004]